jgi:hypothetical protein
MSSILNSDSHGAAQIAAALGLPKNTIGFSLKIEAGKPALLHASMHVEDSAAAELTEVLKRYELHEIECAQDNTLTFSEPKEQPQLK